MMSQGAGEKSLTPDMQVFARACCTCPIEDFCFQDLRNAARELDAYARSRHSHRRTNPWTQRPAYGCAVSTPFPALLSDVVNVLDKAFAAPRNLLAK
jgi:hypothetical protein